MHLAAGRRACLGRAGHGWIGSLRRKVSAGQGATMFSTKPTFALALVLATLTLPATAFGQGTIDDYRRAERFLPAEIVDLAYGGEVAPRWIDRTSRFWYLKEGPDGKEFLLVDAEAATRAPAFDHARIAASLSKATGKEYTARALPFDAIRFVDEGRAIRVIVEQVSWTCTLDGYVCERSTGAEEEDAPPGRAGRLPRTEGPSPDRKLVAFVRDHNLWLRVAATGEQVQLTRDGERFYDYATPLPSPTLMVQQGTEEVVQAPAVFWSPDSKKLATYVMDQRNFPRLTMVQSAPPDQFRPKAFSYAYPLAVDYRLPSASLVLFDVERRRQVPVSAPPLTPLYYGGPSVQWAADSGSFQYREVERGYRRVQLRSVKAADGTSRTIVDERGDPLVNTYILMTRTLNGGKELIWSSERSGWPHLYLYDAEAGTLENQITNGDWAVRSIVHVDEKRRTLFFTAGGREAGRDPYLRHLYRVNLDGKGLALITPEDADHAPSFSPDGRFFVDVYSRADLPAVSVLRRAEDGRVVLDLEKADVSRLAGNGWRPPEPFKAKAADGTTDLYALIWRPTNFDPAKSYPVVENIYTGPHGAFVPKTFAAFRNHQQAMAELGFITVFIDGHGTAYRSRAFRDVSYRDLGQGAGGEDHIAVLEQMAAKYPYMDLTRVGIWGHSAGGYDSTHAILAHPAFYKVAVSSAGCHDNRMDKAVWNEQWMGWPVEKHYEEQSNYTLAKNLAGKLLLAHGDVDENVPIAATIKLVDALVKENKDFDLLIMPNRAHGFGSDPYFIRRRWDYFVEHLLGVDPPKGYRIGERGTS